MSGKRAFLVINSSLFCYFFNFIESSGSASILLALRRYATLLHLTATTLHIYQCHVIASAQCGSGH